MNTTMMAKRDRNPTIDTFTDAYIEAALWSSSDNADDSGGEPLDKNYGPGDIEPKTMAAMRADCVDFINRYGHLIAHDHPKSRGESDRWGMAGHDFWLTRNGHGAGFWDGDWPEHGDELTEASKTYGEFDLYVGDNGEIDGTPLTPRRHRTNEAVDEHRDTRTGRFAPGPGPTGVSARRGSPRRRGAPSGRSSGHASYPYSKSPSDQYILTRDGKEVARGTEQQVWHWMHSHLGYSIDHALRHEGYKITPVEQAGGAREHHHVHDYEALDHRGRRIAGPFKHYDQAKTEADRAGGTVQFVVGDCQECHRAQGAPPAAVPGLQAPRHRHSRHRGHPRYAAGEASRRAAPARRSGPVTAFAIATELSRRAKGTTPNRIPGGHRWTDRNESTHFTTYSPEHSQRVVVLVSVFENDNHIALDFFADDSLSETARYENIGNFLYRGPDYGEMMADLKWVWETVDSYADSWGADQDDVDESRRGRMAERKPNDVAVTVFFSGSKEQSSRTAMSIADVIERATGTKLHWRVSPFQGQWAAQYQYIGRDQYRKAEGAIYAKFGNAVRVTQTALREGTTASEGHNMHSMNASRRRRRAPPRRRSAPAARRHPSIGPSKGTVTINSVERPDLNGEWSFAVQDHRGDPDFGEYPWEWLLLQNGSDVDAGSAKTKAEAEKQGRLRLGDIQKTAKGGSKGWKRRTRETAQHARRHERSVLSRHDAKRMAEDARGQKRRLREGPDAEAAGEQYAEDQLNSDHFKDWMWDQMFEGRRMRKADPKSVIPLNNAADFKKLARNMLQQLRWDIERDMQLRDILEAVGVSSEGGSHDHEVAREFFRGLRAMLEKATTVNWLATEARRMESDLKRNEREQAKGARGRKASEAPQTTRLLPPAPKHR